MPSCPPSPRRWLPERRLSAAAAAAVLLVTGCGTVLDPGVAGSGEITESDREVGSFSEVEVGSAFEVTLSVGDEASVVIRTDDNLQERVTTELDGERLVIEVDGPVRNATLEADLTVPADALQAVELTGAASLTGTDALDPSAFDVVASGASRAFLVLQTGELGVEVSGASVVNLTGTADELGLVVSGASSAQLSELVVSAATADVSGASRVTVHVTDELSAQASGASTVRYVGDPDTVDSDASGGSTIGPE